MTSSSHPNGETPSNPDARTPAPQSPTPEKSDKDGEDAKLRERAKAQAAESTNEDG